MSTSSTSEIVAKGDDTPNCRSQRRKTLRVHRIAAHSPLTHCRTRARASAAPNDARTQAKNKSSPKMIKKQVLITALALALHGAAGDDLCAPASTSAARRVYVGRASRAARRVPTQGTAPSSTVGRRDRGADGRADRAGLVRTASKLNDSFKNPIWSKLEPPALRIGCAPAYQWTGQRHGAWPWALRRAACPRAAPEGPPPHGST